MQNYNDLTRIRSETQTLMSQIWKEGGKLIPHNPYQAEPYFQLGEICIELLKVIERQIQEEILKWKQ